MKLKSFLYSISISFVDLPLVAAFFASQVNVIMVDKVMDYTFPPSVDQSPEEESLPRLLRDYGAQEVMSTRTHYTIMVSMERNN